jgi:acyl-CoA dehydrogenase
MRGVGGGLAAGEDAVFGILRKHLFPAIDALDAATAWIVEHWDAATEQTITGAVPYLKLLGTVAGGWLMARAAIAAERRLRRGEGDPGFNRAKLGTARFYAEHCLPTAAGLAETVQAGEAVMGFDIELL